MAVFNRRESTKYIQRLKHLLEWANWFNTNCRYASNISSKLSKATFILTIQIYFLVFLFVLRDDFVADLIEVFFKRLDIFYVFFYMNFPCYFYFSFKLSYYKTIKSFVVNVCVKWLIKQFKSSTNPTTSLLGLFNFFSNAFSCIEFIELGL